MKFLELFSCSKNKKKKNIPKTSAKYEVSQNTVTESVKTLTQVSANPSTQLVSLPSLKGPNSEKPDKVSRFKRESFRETADDINETVTKDDAPHLSLGDVMKAGIKNPEFKQVIQDLKYLPFESRLRVERYILEKIINLDSPAKYLFDPIWVNCYSNYVCEKTDESAPYLFQPELIEGFILNSYVYSVNHQTWNFLSALYKGGRQKSYLSGETLKQQLHIPTDIQPCLEAQLEATPYLCDKVINCKSLSERRVIEHNYISKHEEKKTPTAYILNKIWFKAYKKYLEGSQRPDNEVNNSAIEVTLKNGTFSEHFCYVNEYVWLFLAKVYDISAEVPVQLLVLEDLYDYVKSFEEYLSEELVNVLDTEIESDKELMSHLSGTTKKLLDLRELVKEEPELDLSSVSEIKVVDDDTDFGDVSSSLID
jgi:hypothetical protein